MATLIEKHTHSRAMGWWVLQLMAGIVFIVTGIWMVAYPADSYLSLSVIFASALIIAGIFEAVFLLGHLRGLIAWGWHFALTLIDIGVGTYLLFDSATLSDPTFVTYLLPFFVGFWILVRGFLAVGIALDFRSQHIRGWVWPLYLGMLTILLASIVLSYPFVTGVSIAGYMVIAFMGFGILHSYLSTKLWRRSREGDSH